jgi:hypothetical protein
MESKTRSYEITLTRSYHFFVGYTDWAKSNCELTFLLFFTGATTLCGSWPPPWFRNSKFFRVGSLAPRPTPNLEVQGLHFVWPLLFDVSGMGGSTTSLRPLQHSLRVIGARKPPLHGRPQSWRRCTYTTNNRTSSFFVLMFVNWHIRQASRMAAHLVCLRSICTVILTR